MAGSSEHVNKPSGCSTKGREILDLLRNYLFLKKESAAWRISINYNYN
jgi:hypothetical protein